MIGYLCAFYRNEYNYLADNEFTNIQKILLNNYHFYTLYVHL